MTNPPAAAIPADMRNLIGAENVRDGSDRQLLEQFIHQRDAEAFAGLVRRHGNTVWGVCRRVLQQSQDVEDAFQAVFLVLARKADSIRKGEAVGNWLYGVAYHTARKAQRSAARRQQAHSKARTAPPAPSAGSEAACRELQRVLDEEVQRLPEKYRAPFVLCCLEGMSRAEAARELLWKEGTVSGRLAEARKLLESRLLRRGITLSAVLTAAALAQNSSSAAAPAALLQNTPQAVIPPDGGSALSPAVLALAESLLGRMARLGVPTVVALLLGLALLIAGAGLAATHTTWKPDSRKELTVKATGVPIAARVVPPGRGPGRVFDSQVVTLAFSPDGKRLAAAGARRIHPGHLKICDVQTARERVMLGGVPGTSSVAFSPDGKTLASGEFGGAVKLRDPDTGEERAGWQAHPTAVRSVVFAPDGALLSTGADGTVRLWDATTLQQRQLFEGHAEAVVAAVYFRHGKGLVTASQDKTAVVWDARTAQPRFTLIGHEDGVEAAAVSPDDKLVATAGKDGTVRLWNAETGKAVAVLNVSGGPVSSVAFSPDGQLLAAAAGRTIRFWNVQTHQMIGSLPRQAQPITTLAFSPAGGCLASGCSLGLMLFALQIDSNGVRLGKEPAQEFYQSLKGAENSQGLNLYGPDAEDCVRFEPAGLRITLPAGVKGQAPDRGVFTTFGVKGDFEITVRFEILKEPRAEETAQQTRFSLAVALDKPHQYMGYLSRNLMPPGSRFTSWATVWDEKAGKQQKSWDFQRTQAMTGRLRLVRTGSLLSYYYAEGPDEEFTLLQQYPFGTEDARTVRLVASTGGPGAAYDVRLTDFRIRSELNPDMPAAPPAAQGFPWAVWLAGAILGVGGFLLLALWGLRRRKRRTEQSPASIQSEPAAAAPSSAFVSFPCSECGKGLKAKVELAGKKVKCSGCGKAVRVPDGEPGQSV